MYFLKGADSESRRSRAKTGGDTDEGATEQQGSMTQAEPHLQQRELNLTSRDQLETNIILGKWTSSFNTIKKEEIEACLNQLEVKETGLTLDSAKDTLANRIR